VASAPVEGLPREKPAGKYAIQLISYKKEGPALKEKDGLSGKKIGAFIVKSEGWYQVCAGSYNDIDEAKKALGEFKKKYEGCFIKNQ
jgi:cell division protein FtsN